VTGTAVYDEGRTKRASLPSSRTYVLTRVRNLLIVLDQVSPPSPLSEGMTDVEDGVKNVTRVSRGRMRCRNI
jgi:hypothetical protein